jgi:hypothetical protein
MSTPKNPLDKYYNYRMKNVLVAFKKVEDASTFNITQQMGREGDSVAGCSTGFIVLTDYDKERRFYLNRAEFEFSFFSPNNDINTSNVGVLEVHESIGYSFLDYLYLDIISNFGDTTVSQTGFALKTFFECYDINGNLMEVLTGNQYVFQVSNIVSSTNSLSANIRTHKLMVMSCGQTVGQMPSYSNIYQMNLTHKDGALHDKVPTPEAPTCGLMPRGAEDGIKYPAREKRLERSKPMKTLKDAFDAFQLELDSQKSPHKAQLQQWLRYVRDNHVDKIEVPPKHKKPLESDDLPIKFEVKLDSEYHSYEIDNRNIIVEQPEQDQTKNGIRTLSFEPSTTINCAIDKIMSLSKRVGEDILGKPAYVPKVSISVYRGCDDIVKITVIIKKIELAHNSISFDTGPGKGAVNPLTFRMNEKDSEDNDIFLITSKTSYQVGNGVMENHIDSPEANIVYGDREQTSVERAQELKYFKTFNSGVRLLIDTQKGNGVEQGDLFSAPNTSIAMQYSHFSIFIRGNPYLLYDVNRKPTDIANENPSNPHYYKFPEYYPMYAKLIIYEKKYATNENNKEKEMHYHDKYYHVTKVRNVFDYNGGNSVGGTFSQLLELRRTDDLM